MIFTLDKLIIHYNMILDIQVIIYTYYILKILKKKVDCNYGFSSSIGSMTSKHFLNDISKLNFLL